MGAQCAHGCADAEGCDYRRYLRRLPSRRGIVISAPAK